MYSKEDLKELCSETIPRHVALIMDGNRRWSEAHNLPAEVGHAKGADQLKCIVEAAIELGIETLTVYAFSTENQKRTPQEVRLLMNLFEKYLIREREEMKESGIRLETIGNLSTFPKTLQNILIESKKMTQNGTRFQLVLAVNYGARDEIKRAIEKMLQDQRIAKEGGLRVTEELIGTYLDTANISDPELLIRTSGEFRLSNFLLWQISYTEIYFSSVFWPDFTPIHFLEAIKSYQQRKIRRGL